MQLHHGLGDRRLRRGTAGELDARQGYRRSSRRCRGGGGRRGCRRRGGRGRGGRERDQRRLGRHEAADLAEQLRPGVAGVGEIPYLGQLRLTLRGGQLHGVEAVGGSLPAGHAGVDAGQLGRARRHLVDGGDVEDRGAQGGHEDADERERDRAGRDGDAATPAGVGGDEVDGIHELSDPTASPVATGAIRASTSPSASSPAAMTSPQMSSSPDAADSASTNPGSGASWPGDDARGDDVAAELRRVELGGGPQLGAEFRRGALEQFGHGEIAGLDQLAGPVVQQQGARLLHRHSAALGQAAEHHGQALRRLPREPAHAGLGDRDVDEVAQLGIEHGALVVHEMTERTDDREDRQVDPLRPQPGAAQRIEKLIDALALGRHDDHAQARAIGGVDQADRLEVHDGAVERHRDALLRLHHQRRADVLLLQRRQIDDAQDGARRGQPDADALGQLVLGEQAPELGGEPLGLRDQPVAHQTGRQGPRGNALGDDLAALEARLRRDRLGGADLQSRDGGRARRARSACAAAGTGGSASTAACSGRSQSHSVEVEVDKRLAREEARRRCRAPGRARTGSWSCGRRCTPLRAITTDADNGAGDERDEHRGSNRAPQDQAHDGGELDVAHPHAGGIGDDGDEEEPAGGGAGDQVLDHWWGSKHRGEHDGGQRERRHDAVRDDPVLEVDRA